MIKIIKYISLIAFLILIVLIQQSFFNALAPQYFVFNLAFVIILCFSFFEKYEDRLSLVAALLVGMLLDILSVYPFGVFIFTFLLLVFLIKKITLLFKGAGVLSFTAVFILSFVSFNALYFILYFFLKAVFFGDISLPSFSLIGLFFSLVVNLILALFFGFVFKVLASLKHNLT